MKFWSIIVSDYTDKKNFVGNKVFILLQNVRDMPEKIRV